jgi:hypothetical protein
MPEIKNWRASDKVIILYYYPWSCGKFLSNILSYNINFIPQLPEQSKLEDYNNTDIKHEHIVNTIPDTPDLKKWVKYELGCKNFYGFYISEKVSVSEEIKNIREIIKSLLKKNEYYTFIVAHNTNQLHIGKTIFPKAIILHLINDQYINELSQKIKNPLYNGDPIFKIVPPPKFFYGPPIYEFDMSVVFYKECFFQEISKFLNWLNVKDKTLDNKVDIYYNKFVGLYQNERNNCT